MLMRSAGWAALGTGFCFLMTTLGAAMVFFFRGEVKEKVQKALLGFAAGVMTAASVWSLLLPAIEQTEQEGKLPGWIPAALGILIGAVFLVLLDDWLDRLRGQEKGEQWRQNALLVTAITLHNIPEGMAVGLAFALAVRGESLAAAMALALGIGINVHQTAADFTPEVAGMATSLDAALGRECCRPALAAALIEALDRLYGVLCTGDLDTARNAYRKDCVTLGKNIQLISPDGSRETAAALDIDEEFGLVVEDAQGEKRTIRSGEVSVRGMYGYVE